MSKFTLIPAALLAAATVTAKVTLPPVYSDHAVFQRQKKVTVRGTAKPGSAVKVTFAGQTKTATAAPNGEWLVKLDPKGHPDWTFSKNMRNYSAVTLKIYVRTK